MTTTEIILTIISSSLISAILTSIVNWLIHRSNYKNDYYKKILEKRLVAYENLNKSIGRLSIHTQIDNYIIPTICFSDDLFSDYMVFLAQTIDSSYWLNSETSTKLTELNVYLLNNISNKVKDNLSPEDSEKIYHKLGYNNLEKIREYRKELQHLMTEDLKSLHDVSKFFKPNNDKQTFTIYKKEI